MSNKPVVHGWDHRPFGLDTTIPGYWQYVHSSTVDVPSDWDGSVNYNVGDTVADGFFIYQCMIANLNVEPGVNSQWARYWVYNSPLFQNGWDNSGGSLQVMRYRISIGSPHVTSKDDNSITTYSDHQKEIQGSVTGGTDASIIFTLPPAYQPEFDLHLSACDDSGAFVVVSVLQSGDVVFGFV